MRLLILTVLTIIVSNILAQQDCEFSHFKNDFISLNPGVAGSSEMVNTNAIFRQQWTGIDGAPQSIVGNIDLPFKLFNQEHGAGLSILSDNIGFNADVDIKISYAYRFNLGKGKMGIGIGGNIQNRGFKPSWFLPENASPVADDNAIPEEADQVWAYDINFGIFYKTENVYFGISSTHLNQSKFSYVQESPSTGKEPTELNKRHYYLMSGYTLQLANPSFEILPSIILQSDGSIHLLRLNSLLSYNKKIWGGVTYSLGSELTGLIGFEILNGTKLGFAYSFPTTDLIKEYKTSFEVTVNYSFVIGVEKVAQTYKSIRIL